jgi:isochorismate pyruvate lyase
MEFKRVRSGAPWETQVGYCRAVRAGNQIFVSGTAPVGADGKVVASGNAYEQTKRCLEIVQKALEQLNCPLSAVARTRMFVTDVTRWAEYGRAHQEFFGEHPPATSMLGVNALIDPAMLIEVEADAVFNPSDGSCIAKSSTPEFRREPYTISTDRGRIDADAVHAFLKRSHWAPNRRRETVVRSIANSLCYGIYSAERQVGFARIVTDYCTFAYLCDVFIDEAHRGQGLSKWLMTCIMKHPDLQRLRRFVLATKDAHGLYRKFGFETGDNKRLMEILKDEV